MPVLAASGGVFDLDWVRLARKSWNAWMVSDDMWILIGRARGDDGSPGMLFEMRRAATPPADGDEGPRGDDLPIEVSWIWSVEIGRVRPAGAEGPLMDPRVLGGAMMEGRVV